MGEIELHWGQDEAFSTPVPRVPAVGERFVGPDDFGVAVVTSVTYEHEAGFAFPPSRIVVTVEREAS